MYVYVYYIVYNPNMLITEKSFYISLPIKSLKQLNLHFSSTMVKHLL